MQSCGNKYKNIPQITEKISPLIGVFIVFYVLQLSLLSWDLHGVIYFPLQVVSCDKSWLKLYYVAHTTVLKYCVNTIAHK